MLDGIATRLRGRSAGEVARLTAATLRHAITRALPAARAARAADRAFDLRWGTDTSDQVAVSGLGFTPDRAAHAVHYQPSNTDKLTDSVAALDIDPASYAFVDYGAGKGRIVMTAMDMGFASVTGVELSARLCAIARVNIASFATQNRHATPASILCIDATEHQPAGEHILAYFYNPFGREILASVVARLEQMSARDVYVIYVQPEHLDIFAERPGWNITRLGDEIAAVRLAPPMR